MPPPDTEHLNLPDLLPGGEVEAIPGAEVADVLDGQVVEAPEPARTVYTVTVLGVVRTARAAAQHKHTRMVARHAALVAVGARALARRRRHARGRAERMMQMAEVAGNHDEVRKWREHLEAGRQARHGRRSHAPETALRAARAVLVWGGLTLLGALVIGILLACKWGLEGFLWPWEFLIWAAVVIADTVTALRLAIPPAAVAGTLVALHEAGRHAGDLAPKWARTAADADMDITIDERAVAQAIKNMRFPQVTEYLKAGQAMQFIVPCRTDGRGTYFEVRLPSGLAAEKVAKRRTDLAASLYRLPKEVWPSVGADAAVLKGWIADKGTLNEGAGSYPLLTEGFTDVFKGLPFGRSLRGDPVRAPVIGRNSIVGGMPEQGKSNGARVIAAGYTLDVTTELRIYVPDTNFDFARFEPRASSYVMGAEDEYIERILGELEELHHELQVRGQVLVEEKAEEVTWELAHAGIGLHPLYVLLEEAHVCIQHHKHGKAFQRLLPEIVKLDRKRAVHMTVSTQAPTKDSMPRDVTRNCTVGVAFAVGDHVANDALLGQGAYSGGHRATELIPGADRGTALCKGFSGEARSEMVQLYRVSGRADDDQVTPLVNRALAELARQGRAVPGTDRGGVAIAYRELLDDLGEIIGPDPIRISELPGRLRKLDKSWGPYRELKGVQLRAQLDDLDVRTTNPGNVPTLDPADLAAARAVRDHAGVS